MFDHLNKYNIYIKLGFTDMIKHIGAVDQFAFVKMSILKLIFSFKVIF